MNWWLGSDLIEVETDGFSRLLRRVYKTRASPVSAVKSPRNRGSRPPLSHAIDIFSAAKNCVFPETIAPHTATPNLTWPSGVRL